MQFQMIKKKKHLGLSVTVLLDTLIITLASVFAGHLHSLQYDSLKSGILCNMLHSLLASVYKHLSGVGFFFFFDKVARGVLWLAPPS